ncbi:DUF1566 domain-containing protein, partial [Candidatus Woesearchaeota archaeon]|nr:DUF1566 domain-containing protein [Candidatus Woesearchaeota archaeon]
ELYSLMDFRGVDVAAESDGSNGRPFLSEPFVFKYGDTSAGDRIIDSQWVTDTVYVDKVMNGEECFFGVNFADGRIKCYPTQKGKGYYTIYVRGESYGANNFFATSADVVIDKASGLTWMRKDSGFYGFNGERWEEALAFCEALTLAGNEWRLPNAKELQSIVDYSRSPSTTNSPAINPLFETSSITNEAGEADYPFFWTSTTHVSERSADQAVYIAFGRAMGKMNGKWMDVHGAGAQRSDPKIGSASEYPDGFGPQGDARRIENYIRCVSGGAEKVAGLSAATAPVGTAKPAPGQEVVGPTPTLPPPEAIYACQAKGEGMFCKFAGKVGTVTGECREIGEFIACVPKP